MLVDHYVPGSEAPHGYTQASARFGDAEVVVVGLSPALAADATLRHRLRRLAGLRHPSLIRLRDFGLAEEDDGEFGLAPGQAYVVADARPFQEGTSLAAERDLGPEGFLAVTVQLLWILDHAHRHGLLLGDIEPRQIVVRSGEEGGLPQVQLLSLGPARGETASTLAAPERRQGEAATPLSDLYALGACVRDAFHAAKPGKPTKDDPTLLLEASLTKLTQDDPNRRYPRAGEALQELLEWAPGAVQSLPGELPEAPLVGRDAQLEQLLAALREQLVGEPSPTPVHWIQLVGEPGSGRSRLLNEAAARLRLQGVSAVETAHAETVIALAERGPVLVVARDLDRASADGQAELLQLVRRVAGGGLRVVVAATLGGEERIPAGLREGLDTVAALSPPRVFALPVLDADGLEELVRRTLRMRRVPAELLDVVQRWCGGNPGLARIALARLVEREVLEPHGRETRVDLTKLGGLESELAPNAEALFPPGLTRDCRKLLRALAVAPGPVSLERLQKITGLPSKQFESAVAPLLEREVLARGEGALSFRRELVKQQVLATLETRERTLLQRGYLRLLQDVAGGVDLADLPDELAGDLAHFALEVLDKKLAARFVPEAARRDRAQGAPRRAAARLAALQHPSLAGKLPAADRVRLLRELGEAHLATGEQEQAEEAFAQALATRSPKVTALERAQLHRMRAGACLGRGDAAGARASLKRAREILDKVDDGVEGASVERGRLTGLEAQEALKAGRLRDVLSITGPVLRATGAKPDAKTQGTLGSLWNLRGLARFHLGEPERARKLFWKSLHLCQELDHAWGISATLGNLGLVADYEGDVPKARKVHRISGAVARKAGVAAQEAKAFSNLANIANAEGRMHRARRLYRRALAIQARLGQDESVSICLSSLGDTFLGEDDPARALPYFERALALAEAIQVPYCQALAKINIAHALYLQGKLVAARKLAAEATEIRREQGDNPRLARALALAARIECRLGRLDLARPLIVEASRLIQGERNAVARAEVAAAHAELLADEGDRAQAREQVNLALHGFGEAHYRWGQARARLVSARLHLDGIEGEEAWNEASRALAEATAAESRGQIALAHLRRIDALLLRTHIDPYEADQGVDHARQARSTALWLGLPELARQASGTLARLLARLGRVEEARAEQLAARKAVERVTDGLQGALARSYKGRAAVTRDTQAPSGEPVAGGSAPPASRSALPAHPIPPSPETERIANCLQAVLTLFQASQAFVLRRDGPTYLLVGSRGASGDTPELPAELLSLAHQAPQASRLDEESAYCLTLPVGGRRGVLQVVRGQAPFEDQDQEMAASFAMALTPLLRAPTRGAKSAPAAAKTGLRGGLTKERWGLVGQSDAIGKVIEQIERFGPFKMPVLVHGASGTGKELVARALHQASPRKEGPFVAMNAGALAESLVVVELFGATKGSYTGATEERPGMFELADQGTLFLDEIGDMPLNVQAMLLRVLEEMKVRRVGGSEVNAVDVRVVCASNQDLAGLVRDGQFREDLYYRLCGLVITLPSLKERTSDVPLLAKSFLRAARREGRGQAKKFTAAALRRLERHPWPGNVRELKNVVERAIALTIESEIDVADLGLPDDASAEPQRGGPRPLADMERDAIQNALREHPTLAAAARALGIDRRTLRRRMKRHGISKDS